MRSYRVIYDLVDEACAAPLYYIPLCKVVTILCPPAKAGENACVKLALPPSAS
jgi:hypothetical protein